MKKNNDSLLATILGGAIFCFVFLGMAFIFTNNTKTMKGNTNSSNQGIVNNEEISLGDTCGDVCNCSNNGTGYCYSNSIAWDGVSSSTCYSAGGVAIWNNTCYGTQTTRTCHTSCTSCDPGKYLLDIAGVKSCVACPDGQACLGGTAQPITCSEGYTLKSDQTGCTRTSCPAGQGLDSSSTTGCSNCSAGYYSPAGDGTCHKCSDGYSSSAGSATCTRTSCPAGQGLDSSSTTGCSNCSAGYYSPENDGVCHPCDNGYTSSVGAASCTKTCASIATSSECIARDDCEWDYTNYCHDKPSVTLVSLDGNDGGAYVTPDVTKKYIIHAVGSDGKNMSNVTWTVTPSNANALASHNCVAGNCEVVVKGWACACPAPKATITVTAKENGSTRTASTTINVTSYGEWREGTWNKPMPSGGTVYTTTALDSAVCRAYGGYQPATGNYAKYYDRCCCGGPSNNPACYIKDDGSYTWTAYPEASWLKVEGISKEEDCKEEETEACYLDPTGEYKWGKYAKETGYTLIESIKDPVLCKKPTSEEACYRKGDDYLWTSTPPEGYTVVEGVTKPEDCGPEEKPACYLRETDGELFWGNYAKVKGYIYLEDIDTEEECKRPESDACYVDKDGNYVWGMYENDPNYTLVPSITEMSQCKADVPVPATGISISKLVYIFMAILMACGVGFIYYSSVVKKNS